MVSIPLIPFWCTPCHRNVAMSVRQSVIKLILWNPYFLGENFLFEKGGSSVFLALRKLAGQLVENEKAN
jgi:hypothetical protein